MGMEVAMLIVVLAVFGEAAIELFKPLLNPAQAAIEQYVGKELFYLYLSSAFGLLQAYAWDVNALEAIGLEMPNTVAAQVGIIVTGLALGRGANFVHSFISSLANSEAPDVNEDVLNE